MADLVNEAISWLQNGEPITGGSGGDSVGVLNRPLVQLFANDNGLQDRIDISYEHTNMFIPKNGNDESDRVFHHPAIAHISSC